MSEPFTIAIFTQSHSHPLFIGVDALSLLKDYISPMAKHIIIVTTSTISTYYKEKIAHYLSSLTTVPIAIELLPEGEEAKTMDAWLKLIEAIFSYHPDRHTMVIALGGGTVGDTAGFAASCILRGLPFIHIPTTLLSQVDSAIGGKCGINTSYGKNTLGSFYPPTAVFCNPEFLITLPEREYLSGCGEIAKYGIAFDNAFFNWLQENYSLLLSRNITALTYAIKQCAQIKATIVNEDMWEKHGKRSLLNFGHTLAHALERVFEYSPTLLHGEAVALGMVFASMLSVRQGTLAPKALEEIISLLKALHLPISCEHYNLANRSNEVLSWMAKDKKASQEGLTLILLNKIGSAYSKKNVTLEEIKHLLEDFLSR